ncbi:MAG: T9SS type A sorting domain-containing protein [Crocinitomicaceae bacterium]|nr:T9SS type A sorting domain-containing protein [Crocinitomicaceae bacterium]
MRPLFFILISVVLYTSTSFAQGEEQKPPGKFTLQAIDEEVHLEITVFQGNICNGMTILRSIDSINWETAGTINGYCGSSDFAIVYDFTDKSPVLNKLNYYQVIMEGLGNTTVRSVFVVGTGEDNYAMWPNPAADSSSIYFKNPKQEEHFLHIYTLSGKEVTTFSTTKNVFELDLTTFMSGTYIFAIRRKDGQKIASGKFIVSQ